MVSPPAVGCRTQELKGALAEIGVRAEVGVGIVALGGIGQAYLGFGEGPGLFFPLQY